MNSREKMDALQESLKNTKGFQRLLDAVYECINGYADEVSADTSYSHTFVHIALQEMVGVADKYTAEEIDTEVEEIEEYEYE